MFHVLEGGQYGEIKIEGPIARLSCSSLSANSYIQEEISNRATNTYSSATEDKLVGHLNKN